MMASLKVVILFQILFWLILSVMTDEVEVVEKVPESFWVSREFRVSLILKQNYFSRNKKVN